MTGPKGTRDAGDVRLHPVAPEEIGLDGIRPVLRTFHQDARGFLVETLRVDDPEELGARFQMTYSSLTRPGQFRDVDRWHVHDVQTDRFVVVLGEMILALYDQRPGSPTREQLSVVRMVGAPYSARDGPVVPSEFASYLVPIPPGVLHCIGNLSREPFLLQNFPTELYDPRDEGRVPFQDRTIASIGRAFSWDLVSIARGPS